MISDPPRRCTSCEMISFSMVSSSKLLLIRPSELFEFRINSHTMSPQILGGVSWTGKHPIAKPLPTQNNTEKRGHDPCCEWDLNPTPRGCCILQNIRMSFLGYRIVYGKHASIESPPSSAEVKNALTYTSIPPTHLHGLIA
jgi:hypothetical protein